MGSIAVINRTWSGKAKLMIASTHQSLYPLQVKETLRSWMLETFALSEMRVQRASLRQVFFRVSRLWKYTRRRKVPSGGIAGLTCWSLTMEPDKMLN